MKVVHVGLGGNSGSAAAIRRLNNKLIENQICTDSVEMTFDGKRNKLDTILSGLLILKNRLFYGRVRTQNGYSFFSCEVSHKIKELERIKSADIIHLHWVEGFYSLSNLKYVLELGKPIVWTCHDSWIFTGGCCVKDGCNKYQIGCENCKFVKGNKVRDISYWHYNKKKKLLKNKDIVYIAPSKWMEENLKNSFLKGKKIKTLANIPGFQTFYPRDKKEIQSKFPKIELSENKFTILVGADSFEQEYKGMQDIIDVLNYIYKNDKTLAEKIRILIIGKNWSDNKVINLYEHYYLGHIDVEDSMACIYSMSDFMLFPSHDDNLPYMVIESLACGTPVLSYAIGGIPEIIDHGQSGYLVEKVSVEKYYEGLKWLIENPLNRENVVAKIRLKFNEQEIANDYIQLYLRLLNNN